MVKSLSGVVFVLFVAAVHGDAVVELDKMSHKEWVQSDRVVMIEYYAPWCGHCKALAPEYEAAAKRLAKDRPPMRLGKLDASGDLSEIAIDVGVEGFPTLLVWQKGQSQPYAGERTASAIVSTMRTVNGQVGETFKLFDLIQELDADAGATGTDLVREALQLDKKQALAKTKPQGLTALSIAPSKDIAELLLNAGADVNAKDAAGFTPLLNHLMSLAQAGADASRSAALHEIIATIANAKDVDAHAMTPNNVTALHLAAFAPTSKTAKLFLEKGLQVDARAAALETPLQYAARSGSPDTVKLLLDRGASPQHAVGDALSRWLGGGKDGFDVVKHLVAAGGKLNTVDARDRTPLHIVVDVKLEDPGSAIAYLLKNGGSVRARDDAHLTPLHMAVKAWLNTKNGWSIVDQLLRAGSDVNAEDSKGRTVAHSNIGDKLDSLVAEGLNINHVDKAGFTPLMWAAVRGDLDYAKSLIKNGANRRALNAHGFYAVDLVKRQAGNAEELKALLMLDEQPRTEL